ncbi:MAG: excinuclease ABC subunit UvrC [Immundisolibacter sp.]|uniref:excinuclease ABC subunit UvrC n=1 Tax=Immundisolibacter sp. TaxID=1934948 RepID=UPI003EE290EA
MTTPAEPRAIAARLPNRPGVYRMLDATGRVIYVGKASSLRKRVGSYFNKRQDSVKVARMVALIVDIEVTITGSEGEALILENSLIKSLRPRYNIMLRDDKSYPYIYLSKGEPFPRLAFHRGVRKGPGRYFGPYPSAGSVRDSLALMQRIFPLRQCEDTVFRARTRPCLQYQIKRCTGPCVGLIEPDDYAEDVRHAELFLEGKNSLVIAEMAGRMSQAATLLDYERAARLRDQIANLRRAQEKQGIEGVDADVDIIACASRDGVACVELLFIRGGRSVGTRAFFPRLADDAEPESVLAAFLPQHYLDGEVPDEIVISHAVPDQALIEAALATVSGHRVRLTAAVRRDRGKWLRLARTNAALTLGRRLASSASVRERYEALQEALGLDSLPQRLECFDISHTMGEAPVASCVVFDADGPAKSDYRRFNIEGVTGGDDYGAMAQAIERRYTRLQKGEGKFPDILLIDGGAGQLGRVAAVLDELQVTGLTVLGVAKGETRRPGAETLLLMGREQPIFLPPDSPALHLIQHIRDEAHRFAIAGHRGRRQRTRNQSPLEDIPQLGPKRRRLLLTRFGGLQALRRAGVDDLAQVPGISHTLAQAVYDVLHGESV